MVTSGYFFFKYEDNILIYNIKLSLVFLVGRRANDYIN